MESSSNEQACDWWIHHRFLYLHLFFITIACCSFGIWESLLNSLFCWLPDAVILLVSITEMHLLNLWKPRGCRHQFQDLATKEDKDSDQACGQLIESWNCKGASHSLLFITWKWSSPITERSKNSKKGRIKEEFLSIFRIIISLASICFVLVKKRMPRISFRNSTKMIAVMSSWR